MSLSQIYRLVLLTIILASQLYTDSYAAAGAGSSSPLDDLPLLAPLRIDADDNKRFYDTPALTPDGRSMFCCSTEEIGIDQAVSLTMLDAFSGKVRCETLLYRAPEKYRATAHISLYGNAGIVMINFRGACTHPMKLFFFRIIPATLDTPMRLDIVHHATHEKTGMFRSCLTCDSSGTANAFVVVEWTSRSSAEMICYDLAPPFSHRTQLIDAGPFVKELHHLPDTDTLIIISESAVSRLNLTTRNIDVQLSRAETDIIRIESHCFIDPAYLVIHGYESPILVINLHTFTIINRLPVDPSFEESSLSSLYKYHGGLCFLTHEASSHMHTSVRLTFPLSAEHYTAAPSLMGAIHPEIRWSTILSPHEKLIIYYSYDHTKRTCYLALRQGNMETFIGKIANQYGTFQFASSDGGSTYDRIIRMHADHQYIEIFKLPDAVVWKQTLKESPLSFVRRRELGGR